MRTVWQAGQSSGNENGLSASHWADLDTLDGVWHAAVSGLDGAWARFRERPSRRTYVALLDALDHLDSVEGRVTIVVRRIARAAHDNDPEQWKR